MTATRNRIGSGDQNDGYLLHSEAELATAARIAIAHAQELGISEAAAIARETAGFVMRVKESEIETAVRDGSQSLTIALFDNSRTGRASTESLSEHAIRQSVERAAAIAREVEPDDGAGLAEADQLARATADVPLFDPSNLPASDLAVAARAAESAALGTETKDLLRPIEAGASSHDMRWALATSQDFCRSGSASIHGLWSIVIAERDGLMVRDSWSSQDRRLVQLESAEAVGRAAARRSLDKLGARSLSTRRVPVLFDATVAGTLVSEFCRTLEGMPQFNRRTYLPDALGRDAMAVHLDLVEDPFEPFGLASSANDSEGVAGSRRAIVEGGTVTGLFLSALSARKLGMRSTGNADGINNLELTSRNATPADDLRGMHKRMGTGLWLTELLGGNVNPVTGSYSKAASGFWIEHGEVAGPVDNFTVAGTLQEMLRGIVAVGCDVYRNGAIRTGSILIDSIQIAGR